MTIQVKPGYDTDTVLTYPTRGNEEFAQFRSALVIRFELEQGEIQTKYQRRGDNLILTVDMSLQEAL